MGAWATRKSGSRRTQNEAEGFHWSSTSEIGTREGHGTGKMTCLIERALCLGLPALHKPTSWFH